MATNPKERQDNNPNRSQQKGSQGGTPQKKTNPEIPKKENPVGGQQHPGGQPGSSPGNTGRTQNPNPQNKSEDDDIEGRMEDENPDEDDVERNKQSSDVNRGAFKK